MKRLHIHITGPATEPVDQPFVSDLLAQISDDADCDTNGAITRMYFDGKTEHFEWFVKVEDKIPNDLALLREARDFSQFYDLPKSVKEALFRVIDENDGLWPCEPATVTA